VQALQYRRSIPRYLWTRLVDRPFLKSFTWLAVPLALTEIPEPRLPTSHWVKISPILSGICGSDLSIVSGKASLYLSALTSFPFIPGHEVVGRVTEVGSEVTGVQIGDRVVLEPALGCIVRGIQQPCRFCQQGRYANCEHITEGDIAPGLQIGVCSDTGGGWGTQLVAHESQLHRVPDQISHEAAVLAEPLSCALHAAFQAQVASESQVLVVGCGSIGLLTIAALRALVPSCHIAAMAKHSHQRVQAEKLGADMQIAPGPEGYQRLAELTGAKLHPVEMDKPAVVGGFDVTFECVGSPSALEDAIRWSRARGKVVMVGMPPANSKLNLAPGWYQESSLIGAYLYGIETWQGRQIRTFEVALDLLSSNGWAQQISALVRHRFPLKRYREAIETAMHAGRSAAIKTVFDFTESPSFEASQP